jgi:hypothetical protein
MILHGKFPLWQRPPSNSVANGPGILSLQHLTACERMETDSLSTDPHHVV